MFALKTFFGVYSEFSSKISGLTVAYNGETVAGRVYFLRGYLVNGGICDVEPSKVESPLVGVLPPGYEWIALQASDDDWGPRASVNFNKTEATFAFNGVFKRDECFEFDALIAAPEGHVLTSSNFKNVLRWRHRITDVAQRLRWIDITSDGLLDKAIKKKSLRRLWWPRPKVIFLLFMLAGAFFMRDYAASGQVAFVPSDENARGTVQFGATGEGEVYAQDTVTGQRTVLGKDRGTLFKPVFLPSRFDGIGRWFYVAIAFLILLAELSSYSLPFTSKGRAKIALVERAKRISEATASSGS